MTHVSKSPESGSGEAHARNMHAIPRQVLLEKDESVWLWNRNYKKHLIISLFMQYLYIWKGKTDN